MRLARATAGGVLRRLAGGAETRRCASTTAAAAAAVSTAASLRRQSPTSSPLISTSTASALSASTSSTSSSSISSSSAPASSSRSSPFYVQTCLFHTSAPRAAGRRRRRFSNVLAADMGLVDEKAVDKFTEEKFPEYTEAEKKELRQKYTPAQMKALEAGEAAVDPRDITVQGRLRKDSQLTGLTYLDDFSQVQPGIDKKQKSPVLAAKMAVDAKIMDLQQVSEHTLDWMRSYYIDDTGKTAAQMTPRERERAAQRAKGKSFDFEEYLKHLYMDPTMVHKDGTPVAFDELGNTSLVTATPHYIPGVSSKKWLGKDAEIVEKYTASAKALADDVAKFARGEAFDAEEAEAEVQKQSDADAKREQQAKEFRQSKRQKENMGYLDDRQYSLEETQSMTQLKATTGIMTVEMNKLIVKQLVHRLVSNQTRLGKIPSFSIITIVGNGNGRLGMGMAKSAEMETAVAQSREIALRNMRPIRRYENRTIYGNVEAKVAGTVVKLYARPPGFGLRVPHRIFEMARAAGITDLAAKIPRSRNPMNSVKATFEALTKQPDPEAIAIGRGKKLVDVRKVYYGGAVF